MLFDMRQLLQHAHITSDGRLCAREGLHICGETGGLSVYMTCGAEAKQVLG
jgi:tartrate dehydratase alpha subunit/fumarate hydratase class I-like protein